jgi:hypothetical protein
VRKKADYVNIRHCLVELRRQPAHRAVVDPAIQRQVEDCEMQRIIDHRVSQVIHASCVEARYGLTGQIAIGDDNDLAWFDSEDDPDNPDPHFAVRLRMDDNENGEIVPDLGKDELDLLDRIIHVRGQRMELMRSHAIHKE